MRRGAAACLRPVVRVLLLGVIGAASACSLLFHRDGLDAETDTIGPADAGALSEASPGSEGGAFVAATGQGRPHWIALDEDAVYWHTEVEEAADSGAIVKLGREPGAGPPARLVGLRNAKLLGVDSTSVYWAVQNAACTAQIRASSKLAGGQGKAVVTTCWLIKDFALDATNVYYVGSGGELARAPKDGVGGGPIRTGDTRVTTIATDRGALYFADDQSVKRIDKSIPDAAGVPFATGQRAPIAIVTDETSVFWINDPAGTVCRQGRDKTSAELQVLARGQANPTAIALDTNHVYWTNAGDGTVMQIPKAGGEPRVIASGQQDPRGITADDRAVYWTNRGDGTIGAVVY